MTAKISQIGKKFLRSASASRALVNAIVSNEGAFANGSSISFKVKVKDGSERTVSVKKVNTAHL